MGAAGTALVNVTLELGGLNEVVTVAGESRNNITLESQAIVRGLDEQQLHDLPRNSRDIQSFLLLNPNVVGGADDVQFLGAKTYGLSDIQDGQASTNAIFGTIGNSAPGLTPSRRSRCSRIPTAPNMGAGGRRGDDQARLQHLPRHQLLRFQQRQLERPDLEPDALGRPARLSACRHPRAAVGRKHRRAPRRQQDVLLCKLRRLEQQGDLRWCDGDRSDGGDAQRRLPRHRDPPRDPTTGQPFPDRVIPSARIDPRRGRSWISTPCPIRARWRTATASINSSCPRLATASAATSESTTSPAPTIPSSSAGATSTAIRTTSSSKRVTHSPTCRC